ncbi:restriction endonuclease subunit S [Lactobacillus kefiranofaciens]|nr:restriction endonuclease subunit S [Lactobacillus kefiranofaciens]
MGNFSCFFVWEQHTLGDFGSVAMNKRIFKNQTTDKGDVPFFKISTFGKKADSFISNNLFEKYKEKYPYPQKGDLLISASGSIGRIVEYKGQKAYYQDSNIVWLNHNKELLNIYLKAYYQIIHWHGIEGSTIKRLYNKNILATSIFVPDKKEQYELGKLIKKAEKIISLQQRKLKQLQLLQKALIQGLLPYSNKFKPTIKIIKNSSHWYIIPVSNLYKRSNEKNDLSFSIKDIISVAKMHWGQNPKKSDDEYMKTYKVFRKGDIAFEGNRSKKFKYGRFVENNLGNGIVSHVFEVYRPTQTINLSFWKFYIHSEQVMHDILRKSTIKATMMTNLVNNDFLKQSTLVPDQKTQQKLGSLFNLVQSELNKQRKKVDELKFIKKFLLQNIFI